MTVLPSSLALTNIVDGSNIVAASHRNNYSAIQTEANAVLAILGAGAAGQVLKGVGTTLTWDYPPGYEWGVDTGSGAAVTSTSESAGTTVLACAAHTFDGNPAVLHFYAPEVQTPTSAAATLTVCLFEGATQIGEIGVFYSEAASGQIVTGNTLEYRFTPTAGAHTYTISAFVSANSGAPGVYGGAGGTGTKVPISARFLKA